MMEQLKAGQFDGLVIYATDRLYRSTRELEDLMDLFEERKFSVQAVRSGSLDLGSPEGRNIARILVFINGSESEKTSSRLHRKALAMAMKGQPRSPGGRTFGYKKGGLVIDEREATPLREITQ